MKLATRLLSVFAIAALASCKPEVARPSGTSDSKGNGRLQLHVANYPLAYFAERIGGTQVDVTFAAPKDEDPAFWQPTDDEVAAMQAADLIVMTGATYS
ncbi:MAG: metal ABC transporter solute-binding protein, Zn/Mn family, partial [Roseimicrobium sp.]